MKVKYEWLKFGHIGRMERTVDAGPWVKHRVWFCYFWDTWPTVPVFTC